MGLLVCHARGKNTRGKNRFATSVCFDDFDDLLLIDVYYRYGAHRGVPQWWLLDIRLHCMDLCVVFCVLPVSLRGDATMVHEAVNQECLIFLSTSEFKKQFHVIIKESVSF